jgi:uncharacterized protein YndB with AHSA1/START domain
MIGVEAVNKPLVCVHVPTGTVRVSIFVHATPEVLWRKITEAEAVSLWFGDLSSTLTTGVDARLDFGDGDFFTITNVCVNPPHVLEYDWRFLDTGPLNHITWQIDAKPHGSLVTVNDAEPGRSKETVHELQEGWTDFLARLEQHIVTGEITRYDLRHDFDGSIELHAPVHDAVKCLLGADAERQWLPFSGGGLEEGARVSISDDPKAKVCSIFDVDRKHSGRVAFHLQKTSWIRSTACQITIEPRGKGSLFAVAHTGWNRISDNVSVCLVERRCFSERWIKTLERIKRVATERIRG